MLFFATVISNTALIAQRLLSPPVSLVMALIWDPISILFVYLGLYCCYGENGLLAATIGHKTAGAVISEGLALFRSCNGPFPLRPKVRVSALSVSRGHDSN